MICKYCGNELNDKDNFCNNCGKNTKNINLFNNKANKNILSCPKCKGTDIDLISTDKNIETKQKTSLNLNPLHPFTIFNTKTVKKEKKSVGKLALGFMTGGASLLVTGTKNKKHCQYFCRTCGHRWISK